MTSLQPELEGLVSLRKLYHQSFLSGRVVSSKHQGLSGTCCNKILCLEHLKQILIFEVEEIEGNATGMEMEEDKDEEMTVKGSTDVKVCSGLHDQHSYGRNHAAEEYVRDLKLQKN